MSIDDLREKGYTILRCKFCGIEILNNQLPLHIKRAHDPNVFCQQCGKTFSKQGIKTHIWRVHGEGVNFKPCAGHSAWNKGLTKESNPIVAKYGKKTSLTLSGRKTGELSDVIKNKISIAMKKAHAEGRAYNIGTCRWNNTPSYPEKFFMRVIENEFNDKNYQYEYNIGRYSIDFAWINKKLAIEIDGKQHELPECKERDIRKEKVLSRNGWKLLRIKFSDMCKDSHKYIRLAKDFIDS